MPTFKNASAMPPHLHESAIRPTLTRRNCREVADRRPPEAFNRQFAVFFRESWQDMRIMNTRFEQSELGGDTRFRQRSEERLQDEEAWSRMVSEGCPNVSSISSSAPALHGCRDLTERLAFSYVENPIRTLQITTVTTSIGDIAAPVAA
jgi:hypothetical protein